jgi:hypothetical protein
MPKNLVTWMNEMKASLKNKGYTKDIPLSIFKSEFMILSGYSKKKVNEWVDNFKNCKLISIKEDKVNFQ